MTANKGSIVYFGQVRHYRRMNMSRIRWGHGVGGVAVAASRRLWPVRDVTNTSLLQRSMLLFPNRLIFSKSTTNTVLHQRHLTTRSALQLLGLPSSHNHKEILTLTMPQLRQAYFAAAKRCHPDTQPPQSLKQDDSSNDTQNHRDKRNNRHDDFLRVTSAYELLYQQLARNGKLDTQTISDDEQAAFRDACYMHLGVAPEVVEECKRSPEFRRWLAGRTDAAHTWRNFLTQHGGLAPQLPLPVAELGMNPHHVATAMDNTRVRRRKRR